MKIELRRRHLETLEFPKILERLAAHTDFSAGAALARGLRPFDEVEAAQEALALTTEARRFLETHPDFDLGGVHDLRPLVAQAVRGAYLAPDAFLDVRGTLRQVSRIRRLILSMEEELPRLADLAWRLLPQPALVEAIAATLDDEGEVRDDASPELARLRREIRIIQGRIQERLQRLITSPDYAPFLQEALITRREGRYVVPVRAEAKGRIRGIVHDRSASGVTLFIEPMAVVELNNRLRELRLAEEEEELRLLAALRAQVAARGREIVATVEVLAELDLAFAKARYAEALQATEPELLPIAPPPPLEGENRAPGTVLRLPGARHPLIPAERVVPVDLVLDEGTHILVLTGPNTGGKTVTLKTAGLLTLMAQAGMHIPADEGAALSFFSAVFADIGDEQSIEQNLSTFSAHLSNIIAFLPQVDHRTLVLLDELGAGTDPAEGAALARALLEALRRRRATALVATHYPELKLYAHETPGVRNASLEFDVETLAPTFRLVIGLPGKSNALAIARRLGLPKRIVREAEANLSGESRSVETMLADLHKLRLEAARARDEARRAKAEAEAEAARLRKAQRALERERAALLRESRAQAEAELEALREEVRALRRRLRSLHRPEAQQVLAEVAEEVKALEAALPEVPAPSVEEAPAIVAGPVRVGDRVRLPDLNLEGEVIALEGKEAVVRAGALRLRLPPEKLERLAPPSVGAEPVELPAAPRPSPGLELDLRGLTVEEALARLDRYLDEAMLAGLPWVRLIHGKGTGRLRRALHEALRRHPLVVDYEPAGEGEGGAGATVVWLEEPASRSR